MTEPKAPENSPQNKPTDEQRPSFLQVVQSVVSAVFGVQSGKNRERDFKQGKASDYIVVYVLLVLALIIGMIITVNLVLSGAGK